MAGWIKMSHGTEVGLGPGNFVLDGYPAPLPEKGWSLPNFWPMSIVANRLDGSRWHLARRWALSRPHCARWGPSSPPRKRGQSPQFSAHFYCGETARCIKMPLGMEVGLSPGDFVLDGDPALLPKKGVEPPQFLAHVYCGQTAEWINMPLGMEVGLSPGDTMLDGDPAPPKKGHCPQFLAHVYCGQTAVCIRIPFGTEVGLSLGDIVRWVPSSPAPKRAQPPIFGQCHIVAKWLDGLRCHLVWR